MLTNLSRVTYLLKVEIEVVFNLLTPELMPQPLYHGPGYRVALVSNITERMTYERAQYKF